MIANLPGEADPVKAHEGLVMTSGVHLVYSLFHKVIFCLFQFKKILILHLGGIRAL